MVSSLICIFLFALITPFTTNRAYITYLTYRLQFMLLDTADISKKKNKNVHNQFWIIFHSLPLLFVLLAVCSFLCKHI